MRPNGFEAMVIKSPTDSLWNFARPEKPNLASFFALVE
jgi:hypothetical protein